MKYVVAQSLRQVKISMFLQCDRDSQQITKANHEHVQNLGSRISMYQIKTLDIFYQINIRLSTNKNVAHFYINENLSTKY